MKKLIKLTLALAVMFMTSFTMNASENDPKGNLIYNTEEVDGVVVSETVYKMEGGALTNYMKHNYKYDADKQRIEDEALKWNGVSEEWEKNLCMRYSYSGKSVTTEYYKWNKKKKEYILIPEMTITMDK